MTYVSKDNEHDPGGDLEPRKRCPGPPGDEGHYAPISEFGPSPQRGDGLRSLCRNCDREAQRRNRRDAQGRTKKTIRRDERWEEVRPWAEQGFDAREIAEKLDNRWSKYTIQRDVREMGLSMPQNGYRGRAPVSVLKQLEAATVALAGISHQLDQLRLTNVVFPEEVREWEKELTKASYSLNRVRRQLKQGRNSS